MKSQMVYKKRGYDGGVEQGGFFRRGSYVPNRPEFYGEGNAGLYHLENSSYNGGTCNKDNSYRKYPNHQNFHQKSTGGQITPRKLTYQTNDTNIHFDVIGNYYKNGRIPQINVGQNQNNNFSTNANASCQHQQKILMKNIFKVDPSRSSNFSIQNKLKQFNINGNESQTQSASPSDKQTDYLSPLIQPRKQFDFQKVEDIRRNSETLSTNQNSESINKKICKMETFLNPLLFQPLEEVSLIEVDLKTSSGVLRLKLSKHDDITQTIQDFCNKNSLPEKLTQPIHHMVSKALKSLNLVLNSKLSSEQAQHLSEVISNAKQQIKSDNEEASTTLSEGMSNFNLNESFEANDELNNTM